MPSVKVLILDPALRKMGVTRPDTPQLRNALADVNAMIGSLSAKRNFIFQVTRESFPLVVNDAEYTIGTSGDFNTVRPNKITDAFLRDGTTDTPLLCRNLSDYNKIPLKSDNGRPEIIYYLQEFPLGKILFDREPSIAYTLFIDSWKPLSSIADINTVLSLPPEYEEFLVYNLAIRLAPEYDETLSPEIVGIARDGLDAIKGLNANVPEEVDYSFLPIHCSRFNGLNG